MDKDGRAQDGVSGRQNRLFLPKWVQFFGRKCPFGYYFPANYAPVGTTPPFSLSFGYKGGIPLPMVKYACLGTIDTFLH